MSGERKPDVCALGVAFIDSQLLTLYTHASLLAEWVESGAPAPNLEAATRLLSFRRSAPEAHTHSEDGMPTKQTSAPGHATWPAFDKPAQRATFAFQVPCMNAIIAVADLFDVHRLSASRTPEVQFLMRLREAAMNGDTFHIAIGGHMPHAAFGGLIVDEHVNDHALFGNETREGFVQFGDVVALLEYLRKLLQSMRSVISSGDAG